MLEAEPIGDDRGLDLGLSKDLGLEELAGTYTWWFCSLFPEIF